MARKKQGEPGEAPDTEQQEPSAAQGGDIEIELDDDDEGDDEGDDEPAPSQEPGQTAQEPGVRPSKRRRANQYRELETRAEAAERRAREAEEALHRTRLESFQQVRPQQAEPQEDPDEAEYKALAQRGRDLVTLYNALNTQHKGNIPAQDLERLQSEADAIQRKQQGIVFRIERRNSQPDPQVQARQELLQQVQARYPDVVANRAAFTWALAEAQKLIAKGVPNSWEMSDHVMDLARAEFGIGKGRQAATDPSLKQRLTGMPRGASPPAGGGKRTFTMTQKDREMADQAFPHLKPTERYKHYARRLAARHAQAKKA